MSKEYLAYKRGDFVQKLPTYYLPMDKNGRVVIPKAVRDALGFSATGSVRAIITDKKIILESGRTICKLCGNESILCEDLPICSQCIEKVNQLNELYNNRIPKIMSDNKNG